MASDIENASSPTEEDDGGDVNSSHAPLAVTSEAVAALALSLLALQQSFKSVDLAACLQILSTRFPEAVPTDF